MGIIELYENWKALEEEAKAAKSAADEAKAELLAKIPAGEVRKGIQHKVISRSATKWKDATRGIIDNLVPKSKAQIAQDIIDAKTVRSEYGVLKDLRDASV